MEEKSIKFYLMRRCQDDKTSYSHEQARKRGSWFPFGDFLFFYLIYCTQEPIHSGSVSKDHNQETKRLPSPRFSQRRPLKEKERKDYAIYQGSVNEDHNQERDGVYRSRFSQ